jgi:hypothetical protein
MPLLTITLLTANLLCLIAILAIVIYVKKQRAELTSIENQLSHIELSVNALEFSFSQQKLKNEQADLTAQAIKTEYDQISQSLERRIKYLQTEQIEINDKLASFNEQQQPEDKLYSRALKLVGLGADIDEIIRDCDIPRVEAEMLLSIHQQRNK